MPQERQVSRFTLGVLWGSLASLTTPPPTIAVKLEGPLCMLPVLLQAPDLPRRVCERVGRSSQMNE